MVRTAAADRWSKLIDQHEASGLTINAFADANNVNANTLSKWRSRLGRTRTYTPRARFVELTLAEPPSVNAIDATAIVLSLDDFAAHVVVKPNTDLVLLKRILKALC